MFRAASTPPSWPGDSPPAGPASSGCGRRRGGRRLRVVPSEEGERDAGEQRDHDDQPDRDPDPAPIGPTTSFASLLAAEILLLLGLPRLLLLEATLQIGATSGPDRLLGPLPGGRLTDGRPGREVRVEEACQVVVAQFVAGLVVPGHRAERLVTRQPIRTN